MVRFLVVVICCLVELSMCDRLVPVPIRTTPRSHYENLDILVTKMSEDETFIKVSFRTDEGKIYRTKDFIQEPFISVLHTIATNVNDPSD